MIDWRDDRHETDHRASTRTTTSRFTEDYPRYFDDDFDFEIVLGVELVAELIRDGKLQLTSRSSAWSPTTIACRLNKRKGIHAGAARDPARDPRAHVHGRRPRDAVVVLLRRRRRAPDREAGSHRRDLPPAGREGCRSSRATRSSRPASGRSGRSRSRAGREGDRRLRPHGARRRSGRDWRCDDGGDRNAPRRRHRRARRICGEEHVFTEAAARFNRARVPAPFPVTAGPTTSPTSSSSRRAPSRSPRSSSSRTASGSRSSRGPAARA